MLGRVYKISNGEDSYVGSTIQSLVRRFSKHKSDAFNTSRGGSLFKAFREKGIECFKIELLEELPVVTLEDVKVKLRMRERHWYDELKPNLNDQRPWVSEEEKKEYLREKALESYYRHRENKIARVVEYKRAKRAKGLTPEDGGTYI